MLPQRAEGSCGDCNKWLKAGPLRPTTQKPLFYLTNDQIKINFLSSGVAALHSFNPFTKQQENSVSEDKIPRQGIYP